MLNEPTTEKLQALRLPGMLAAWQEQQRQADVAGLSFDERFALLVEAEWLRRENERLVRHLREAKLRLAQASLEDVDYSARRELDRAQIRQLASGAWIAAHQHVLITGATGTGKTFLACALAHQACRHGHRALYRRVSRLFDELTLARADGTYARALARLARADVLILDDFALAPLDLHQRQDLLEVLEDRTGTRSTIVTSQLPVAKWHAYVDDPTLADAICDRLLHNAHRIVLKGPSRRKAEATSE
ncbi:MAG: IS21-like element helper ATPase IstB [Candidatus Binatia bacterium]